MWILVYWVICGLIIFSLTQPTVYVFNFPWTVFWEFIACMIIGGILVPILGLASILYWIKVILFGEEDIK